MKRRAALAAGVGAGLGAMAMALPGCASYYYGEQAGSMPRTDLIEANYRAVDMLLQSVALDPSHAVLVATLVNVDRLTESSRLGRLCSEQIAGRLAQRGVRVTELKLREALAMRHDQGELLLSRELHEVSQLHEAQAVVVGAYAVSPGTVYVSLKMVKPVGNAVVAAYDYALPVDDNLRSLLAGR